MEIRSDRDGLGPNRPKHFFDLPASKKQPGVEKKNSFRLSVGTLAKPVEGHATRRPADGYSRRGGEHGKRSGDLSNAPGEQDVPQARCNPPLAAFKKISGPAFPHVPADILSGGRARRSSSGRNTQRIEAKEKRCGEENRHLRFSSLRLNFFFSEAESEL